MGKIFHISTLTLIVTLLSNPVAFAKASEADAKFIADSSYAMGVFMGKNLQNLIEKEKPLFAYDPDLILNGIQDTLKKQGKLTDEQLQKQLKALHDYLSVQEQKIVEVRNKETISAGEKFRSEFEKKSGVKKTKSGLLYKIEKAGEGNSPQETDIVIVNYKGSLVNGEVFDSSYERNKPVEFPLNKLIPAWTEALPMLKKGGKMQLVVPPESGYGDQELPKIPAYSTLIFEIELLDFKSNENAK